MQNTEKKIGISGGTFDPIHYGHLITAENIREKFGLEKVVFMPSGKPPHKTGLRISPAEHRYNMVCAATASNPYFEVLRIELDRPGYTYTIDTLVQLKNSSMYNGRLYFITGADVIPDILSWKDSQKLLRMCEFIVVIRPGYDKEEVLKRIEELKNDYGARFNVAQSPLIGISSTEIRERVRNGKSIKYLVPESVEKYIYENGLYVD